MANSNLIYEDIAQLLQEADCPDAFIQQFLAAMETENAKVTLWRGDSVRKRLKNGQTNIRRNLQW